MKDSIGKQPERSDVLSGVSVHTGFPNPGTDASLQSLNLNQLLIEHSASTYLMKIVEQSWQALGIFPDDIVIVDRALEPHANDLVIWWHDDTFAVSPKHALPAEAVVFGVVRATIHQFWKRI
jgi:hypothetical protein